jgi:hypothetical protein
VVLDLLGQDLAAHRTIRRRRVMLSSVAIMCLAASGLGLKEALASMNQTIMPGDKIYVYFSGHGARFFSKASGQCMESIVMQDMHVVTNTEFAAMLKPLSAKTDKTIVMLDSCHSGGVAQAASSRDLASGTGRRAKYLPDASSPQCSLAVNDRSFSHGAARVCSNVSDASLVRVEETD